MILFFFFKKRLLSHIHLIGPIHSHIKTNDAITSVQVYQFAYCFLLLASSSKTLSTSDKSWFFHNLNSVP